MDVKLFILGLVALSCVSCEFLPGVHSVSHCPDGQAPSGDYCGLGPFSSTCPAGHYCEVAPNDAYAECCPVAVKDVKSHCPDGQASLSNHKCGRGGTRCPSTHYCEISPVDAYAECCPTPIIG